MKAELKKELCKICALLFDRMLVSGTDGNISVRAGDGAMYITPSGVSKGFLEDEHILLQGLDGVVREGKLRSTKEAGLHAMIYKSRPDIGAVIHTHPCAATAFAACGTVLPQNVLIEAPLLLGDIALIPYAEPGSQALVDHLEAQVQNHDIFFLRNHGVIVCGQSLTHAFDRMDALENTAKSILYTRLLGGAVPISEDELASLKGK